MCPVGLCAFAREVGREGGTACFVVGSFGPALADTTGNECECRRRCGWNRQSDWLTRAAGIGWDVPAIGEGRLSTRRF